MKIFMYLGFCLLFTGCTISRHVDTVDSGVSVEKIYVEYNEKVHMEGMNDELVQQFSDMGFDAELYEGDLPEGAEHYFQYTANWAWDMAMYLTFFKGTLYENGEELGEVEYDALGGGMNMAKFGKTADLIRPLMLELMSDVTRGSGAQSAESIRAEAEPN